MRLLVVTHSSHTHRKSSRQLFAGLTETTDLSVADWDQMAERSVRAAGEVAQVDLAHVDACMIYVRFRYFMLEPFDWSGFDGRRVLYEPDAWFGYSPAHREWHGRFAAVYRRDNFDLMISTGKDTTARLVADGVHAAWMPKAYDSSSFSDLGGARSDVCTFGSAWPTRRALIAQLGGLVTDVSAPYTTLNEGLNRYAGALVCNMPGTTPLGKVGRAIRRWRPGFVRAWPGVEPMIKTFEVAGAGCAPIVDHIDELADLGFVSGRSCLTYRTLDEAVSTVRRVDPDRLREVGLVAADLARSRHTWRHRAEQLPQLIEGA
ncbi:MAG: glycosyltransferase family protein [Acidimicrobiales bacterium]